MTVSTIQQKKEFRKQPRKGFGAPVRIFWQDATGQRRSCVARCLDISETGLRGEVTDPLPTRILVKIQAPEYGLLGMASVRHCRARGMKWTIGLEFCGGLRWKDRRTKLRA